MKKAVVVGVLALSASSYASARDDSFEIDWGFYAKAGNYSVEDPDGSADEDFTYAPGVKVTLPFSRRGQQFVAGAELIDFELDASEKNVGQDVSGYRFWGGYEHRFNLSRSFKVWGGVGLTLDTVSFENRHTIDENGYLKDHYENLDETYSGFSIYGLTTIDVGRRAGWEPAIGLFMDQPFGDGVSAWGLSFQVLFK